MEILQAKKKKNVDTVKQSGQLNSFDLRVNIIGMSNEIIISVTF